MKTKQKKPNTRMVAKIIANPNGKYDNIWILTTDQGRWIAEASNGYSRPASAKRGLIRFLARLGIDKNAVRWES